MLADDELRAALTTRAPRPGAGRRGRARPAPRPRRLARAPATDDVRRRPGRRRHGHRPRARPRLAAARPTTARARSTTCPPGAALEPARGKYVDPADLASRPLPRPVRFGPVDGLPAVEIELDIPRVGAGRRLRLRHRPESNDAARRIDLVGRRAADRGQSVLAARRGSGPVPAPSASPARWRRSRAGRASAPMPVTPRRVSRGTGVRLDPAPRPRGTSPARTEVVVRESPAPRDRQDLRDWRAGPAGVWVLDVEGHPRPHQRQPRSGRHAGPGGGARRDRRVHLVRRAVGGSVGSEHPERGLEGERVPGRRPRSR